MFRLFISHITTDKKIVAQVKRKLSDLAVDAFVAHKDIAPTKEWITEIESALESCDALAAFLTTKFYTSKWTDQEIGYCLKRRVLIIPVQMGIDPYGFLARYQGLQAANLSADDIATKLVDPKTALPRPRRSHPSEHPISWHGACRLYLDQSVRLK